MSNFSKYEVAGKPLKCLCCHADLFSRSEALLNTRGLTFLKLDWLNTSANAFECANCGFIMWFKGSIQSAEQPKELPPENFTTATEPIECFSCKEMIPPNATECQKCGWSYAKK